MRVLFGVEFVTRLNARDMAEVFQNHGKRIGVFVIAYNAESHIQKTLQRIPQDVWDAVEQVYVIDDCSSDNTVEKALECIPWSSKLRVLRNRVNRRYGGNQKIGYQYAIDQNFDVVVMLHADGQYAPEHLPRMLQPIVEDQAEVVLGSRMMYPRDALKGGMPLYKFIGNRVLTWIQNALTGLRLSEFHSGYRAYSVAFLRQVPFWDNSDEWHFDTEILLQAQRAGARIVEIPIPTFYGDEICYVNGIVYAVNCILTSFKYWLFRKGIYYSRTFDVPSDGRKYPSRFEDPFSSHSKILKMIREHGLRRGLRVLELSYGDGAMVDRLAEEGASVDVIDIDSAVAERVRGRCRTAIQVDLDQMPLPELSGPYDVILAADILEHLRNPERILSHLKKLIHPDGRLIVSLPNFANVYVRVNLLFGRIPQHSRGLLDRSHLRYFTLRDMERLLTKTGWIVVRRAVTPIPLGVVFPFLLKMPFRWTLWLLDKTTSVFKGLLAYQGLFECRNPNKPFLL